MGSIRLSSFRTKSRSSCVFSKNSGTTPSGPYSKPGVWSSFSILSLGGGGSIDMRGENESQYLGLWLLHILCTE